ncbi:MAG: peptidoglycan-binding protein, partial [Oricola sp.]
MTVLTAMRGIVAWLGEVIVANPGSAGAVTAFGVAMTFFTANAVYFQDHQHPSALFATRPELVKLVPESDVKPQPRTVAAEEPNVTRFILEDQQAQAHARIPELAPVPAPRPTIVAVDSVPPQPVQLAQNGDKSVAGIQELLIKLGYYDGTVDGLRGPKTNAAIDSYKNNVGLRGIELTDAELVTSIRNNLDVTAAIPAPRPQPA